MFQICWWMQPPFITDRTGKHFLGSVWFDSPYLMTPLTFTAIFTIIILQLVISNIHHNYNNNNLKLLTLENCFSTSIHSPYIAQLKPILSTTATFPHTHIQHARTATSLYHNYYAQTVHICKPLKTHETAKKNDWQTNRKRKNTLHRDTQNQRLY